MEIQKIYEMIALKYNVPAEEVRSEMQQAIDAAWLNPDKTPAQLASQRQIPSAHTIPTPEELIIYAKHALASH